MRPDGLPLQFHQVTDEPLTPFRSLSNWNIFHFGKMVSTCLWMWQGWIKPVDTTDKNLIQLPFVFTDLREGDELINVRNKEKYKIKTVLDSARSVYYKTPLLDGVPESTPFESRTYKKDFHPDELTGVMVKIESVDGDSIDIDYKKGDFLSLVSSRRVLVRQLYAETVPEDSSGYWISWRIGRSQPGTGKEPFDGNDGPKKQRRPIIDMKQNNPVVKSYVEGQFFDNLVEFDLHAPNAEELNRMTAWFLAFMERHVPVFLKEGFNTVYFWDMEQVNETIQNRPGGGDTYRVRYFVRTEQLSVGSAPRFRKTTISTNLFSEEA